MKSRLEWQTEEEGTLIVYDESGEWMQLEVYRISADEAELKLKRAEIVETTQKINNISEKIIYKVIDCLSEAFRLLWEEGYNESVLVEQQGTKFWEILDSTDVVEHIYSEYMMQRIFEQKCDNIHNSDNLVFSQEEDEVSCKDKQGDFSCRLLRYPDGELPAFYVYEVEVKKQKRNQGIATGCLTTLFEILTKDTPAMVCLQVGSYNEPAVHLYEKLGFTVQQELCYYSIEEGMQSWQGKSGN